MVRLKGFTLIETTFALALMTIILSSAFFLFNRIALERSAIDEYKAQQIARQIGLRIVMNNLNRSEIEEFISEITGPNLDVEMSLENHPSFQYVDIWSVKIIKDQKLLLEKKYIEFHD